MSIAEPEANESFFAEFLDDYFAESEEHLILLRRDLLVLEEFIAAPAIDRALLDGLFRSFHSLKGISGMVGLRAAEQLAHHMESYLRDLRQGDAALSPGGMDALIAGTKMLEEVIAARRRQVSGVTEPAHRQDCLKVWEHLARRYGERPGVLLELLNEPVAPSYPRWNEVQAELVEHVRRLAPRSTLVLASNLWNGAAGFEHLAPVRDENVLYTFHCYAPLLFTHQLAPWVDGEAIRVRRRYPGEYTLPPDAESRQPLDAGRWDRARLAEHLEPVFRFRDRHGARVACTEFGVYVGGPDRESQLAWTADILGLFREHGIGWSYWTYKNLDFGLVSRGEGRHAHLPQYAEPDRIDRALVALLQRG